MQNDAKSPHSYGIVNPPGKGPRVGDRTQGKTLKQEATATPANNGNYVQDDANNHGNHTANANNGATAEEQTREVFEPPSLAEIATRIQRFGRLAQDPTRLKL